MIRKFCFAALAALMLVGCSSHFISDETYREKVEQDFAKRFSNMANTVLKDLPTLKECALLTEFIPWESS